MYVPVYLADIHYAGVYIDSEEMRRDAVAHFPAAKYVVAAMLKSLIKELAGRVMQWGPSLCSAGLGTRTQRCGITQ